MLTRVVFVLAACSAWGCGQGGGNVADFSAQFDIHGASNSPCALIVANGGQQARVDIAAPDPPVMDTSLSPPAPVEGCTLIQPDAGGVSVSAMSSVPDFNAWRTSTQLCVENRGRLMAQLGFDINSGMNCPVTVTLSCGGVVLYDHVHWTVCHWFG